MESSSLLLSLEPHRQAQAQAQRLKRANRAYSPILSEVISPKTKKQRGGLMSRTNSPRARARENPENPRRPPRGKEEGIPVPIHQGRGGEGRDKGQKPKAKKPTRGGG